MKKQNNNNPWKILGISPTATHAEIKEAYKELAKKHHPDAGGKISDWLEVSRAYDAIKSKKHIPILEAPSTKMLNIRLTISQQINGVDDIIQVDGQQEELYIKVKIPAGALKDDKFNVVNGKQRYIINIKEQAHPDFVRHGLHLATYKTLDITDALLRKPFMIQSPTGEYIEVEVPDRIETDQIITVPGHGLFNRRTKQRGNLRIHVKIGIPIVTQDNIEEFITRLRND
jgi:DnaJ-class molecular chaperone